MNQQAQYRLIKETREGEKIAKFAKENGYFTKQEVHNLIGSALADFISTLISLPNDIVVGSSASDRPLIDVVSEWENNRKLDMTEVFRDTWQDIIKKV